jgi:putative endonuclease
VGLFTDNIHRRTWEHKNDINPGFTHDYKIHRLVYYETFKYANNAIAREKSIKGWLRRKKIALIEAENPTWEDLSEKWFDRRRSPGGWVPHFSRSLREVGLFADGIWSNYVTCTAC